ncbi:PKD domain-containing protein [Nannocystaceae bacterium ST9]
MRRFVLFAIVALAACRRDDAPLDGEVGSESGASESSSSESSSSDTSDSSDTSIDTDTGEPAPLESIPGPDRYVIVEAEFELDASASTGAVLYQWNFADGTPPGEPGPDPIASHSYPEPGRYYPVLTVWDEQGNSLAASLTVTATHEPSFAPRPSSTIVALDPLGFEGAAVVSPDSDELTILGKRGEAFEVVDRFPTCDRPRTIAIVDATRLALTCQASEQVMLFTLAGPQLTLDLPRGSRPFAAVAVGDRLVVSLAASGELARFDLSTEPPTPLAAIPAIADARGLAPWPDGRVAVTRWRSSDAQGELALVDPISGAVEPIALAYDPTPPSDTEIGGVPSYLDQILVSPIADEAALPSLQADFGQGEYLSGAPLTFETTVRGIVSWIELTAEGELLTGSENFDRRKQFDNRGFASAGVYSSHGDYLFVAMLGNRVVERYDVLSGAQAGSLIDVGYAPSGLALSADDRYLYVDAFMSREVRVYDVGDFSRLPQAIAQLPIPSSEPLAPEVLRGKQLFNDSFDPRISKDGYIACAHCHLDGEADRRTWDFTDRGEGLRNTISLLGRGGVDHGPIHWSSNFDEVQDFEHDLRGPFQGAGLLADDDWNSGTVNTTLGDPKAGLSADLDALAAYVESLSEFPRSPHRNGDGSLSADAAAGKVLFESPALGCTTCHVGARMTDSAWIMPALPLLHDVGTIGPGSGQRLGGPLLGIDTPTLHELWNSPPYLHDGSAADLAAVLTTKNAGDAHGTTSQLSGAQIEQLVAYLLALEGVP